MCDEYTDVPVPTGRGTVHAALEQAGSVYFTISKRERASSEIFSEDLKLDTPSTDCKHLPPLETTVLAPHFKSLRLIFLLTLANTIAAFVQIDFLKSFSLGLGFLQTCYPGKERIKIQKFS